jgi:hypothetical protein
MKINFENIKKTHIEVGNKRWYPKTLFASFIKEDTHVYVGNGRWYLKAPPPPPLRVRKEDVSPSAFFGISAVVIISLCSLGAFIFSLF